MFRWNATRRFRRRLNGSYEVIAVHACPALRQSARYRCGVKVSRTSRAGVVIAKRFFSYLLHVSRRFKASRFRVLVIFHSVRSAVRVFTSNKSTDFPWHVLRKRFEPSNVRCDVWNYERNRHTTVSTKEHAACAGQSTRTQRSKWDTYFMQNNTSP